MSEEYHHTNVMFYIMNFIFIVKRSCVVQNYFKTAAIPSDIRTTGITLNYVFNVARVDMWIASNMANIEHDHRDEKASRIPSIPIEISILLKNKSSSPCIYVAQLSVHSLFNLCKEPQWWECAE